MKKYFPKLVLLLFLASAILACVFVPSLNAAAKQAFAMFASGDFERVRDAIAAYGVYAAGVSFALMVFQSIVAPLPAFLITFANANLFGWQLGALLSWTSAMAGAALCFFIARILGRETAEKLTSKAGLSNIDRFFENYGKHAVLIARLLPFISFDIVSYAAGLTAMKFWPFFAATGIGQLPATLVYSYVGGMLTGGARFMVTALLILFALSVLIVLLRQMWAAREAGNSKVFRNENAVIFFTRVPVPGQCKTRLIPSLGAETACALQRAFIADIAAELYKTKTSCDVIVCFEPDGNPKTLETLITGKAEYTPQRGANLGERMHNALSEAFSCGYRKAVLLGSDLPLIEAKMIDNAFASLDGCDCVLLPTIDGGYGLIGVKEPDASLFGLSYGGSSVAEETQNAIARGGKTCALLPPTLDIDDIDDLTRLRSSLSPEGGNACPETRRILAAVFPTHSWPGTGGLSR